MIQAEIRSYSSTENVISFRCPVCGADETSFAGMPINCYLCGNSYGVDVEELVSSKEKRIYYHFNETGAP